MSATFADFVGSVGDRAGIRACTLILGLEILSQGCLIISVPLYLTFQVLSSQPALLFVVPGLLLIKDRGFPCLDWSGSYHAP